MRLIVESPAPDLNESLTYYNSLGFRCSTWKKNGLCQTKNLTIFLNTSAYSRPCINLYEAKENKLGASPSGTWVKQEREKLTLIDAKNKSLLGNYGGVCIETLDLNASFIFWQAKGFKGILEPEASWCSLKNENGDTISLLKANSCPHLFTNPSLAFFNGHQNSKIITHLKALNVPIKQEVIFGEEIIADNLIINDPGGLGFFIFND